MVDPCSPDVPSPALADTLPAPAEPLWIQARHLTTGRRAAVQLVVIHTAEVDCRPGVALAVANYFANPPAPQASAHYVVGPEIVVQCVAERDTAWAAPGANPTGVHVELAARASWSAEQWLAPDVEAMLARAAQLVADICRRHGVPVVRLDVEGVRAGQSGLCGHVDASKAWKKSDHWDPGPGFPWARFLDLVKSS
jgi:N-acetyl-anhydromuramyl-L-alanine amidase AmpD